MERQQPKKRQAVSSSKGWRNMCVKLLGLHLLWCGKAWHPGENISTTSGQNFHFQVNKLGKLHSFPPWTNAPLKIHDSYRCAVYPCRHWLYSWTSSVLSSTFMCRDYISWLFHKTLHSWPCFKNVSMVIKYPVTERAVFLVSQVLEVSILTITKQKTIRRVPHV